MSTLTKYANAHTAITTGYTNPTNAYVDDTNYATAAPGKNTTVSAYYGFPAFTTAEIPDGSTINSVKVQLLWKCSTTGSIATQYIQVFVNTSAVGSEQSDATEPAGDTVLAHTVTTGVTLANLRTADVVRARLRSVQGSSNTAVTFSIDYVFITVDYTAKWDMAITKGDFTLTGQSNILSSARLLGITKGDFTLTGKDVTLVKAASYALPITKGDFALTGQDVALQKTTVYSLAMGYGSYALGGQALALSRQLKHNLDYGSYAYTGQNPHLSKASVYTVACEYGTYNTQLEPLVITKKVICTTGADAGGGDLEWRDTSYVLTKDGTNYAYVTNDSGSVRVTNDIIIYGDSPNIPSNATILGVEVSVTRCASNNSAIITDYQVRLRYGDKSYSSENYASEQEWPVEEFITATYGSPTSSWGDSLTPTIVNSSTFGAVVSAEIDPSLDITAQIDAIEIFVYYSVPVSTALTKTLNTSLAHGQYTLTGKDVTLSRTIVYSLPITNGSFTYTGQDVTFPRTYSYILGITNGSYSLTGQDNSLTKALNIPITYGSYALTGKDVTLSRTIVYSLPISNGSFIYTGQTLGLTKGLNIPLVYGSHTLTGQNVALDLKRVYALICSQGSYSLNGQAVPFTKALTTLYNYGTYGLEGQSVTLNKTSASGLELIVDNGSYGLSGGTVVFTKGLTVALSNGSYGLTGTNVSLSKTTAYLLAISHGNYTLTGQDIQWNAGLIYTLIADAGHFKYYGINPSLDWIQLSTIVGEHVYINRTITSAELVARIHDDAVTVDRAHSKGIIIDRDISEILTLKYN